MKAVCTLLAAALLWMGLLTAGAELVNGINAIVDDSVITYDEVQVETARMADTLIRRYRGDPETLDKEMADIKKRNLETLLNRQLILHEFKTAGYVLPESVIDDLVRERIKARFHDEVTLTKTLQEQGMTKEKFRQQVREQFIIDQLRLKNVSSDKIIISPHKVEAYYLAHREEFKIENEVKLRTIILKTSEDTNAPAPAKLAEEIFKKINGGASFEQMASLYSQGSQRSQGGDWGWWTRKKMTKGLSDIAFSLPPGKCSGVFGLSSGDDYWVYQYEDSRPTLARHYGIDPKSNKQVLLEERKCDDASAVTNLPPAQEFYLLKVDETRQEHFKSLGEVRDEVEKNLLEDEKTRLENEWLGRLRKKTFVSYF
ncbi:MAG TPA: peptidylprolyl isomerase [Candidatus Binatia bacterium]|jgi:peptidyl-prolyl cis-trans isomerase SurA|nr:peptidylprolyl isomerase [Candidatus Binatia bacterium]